MRKLSRPFAASLILGFAVLSGCRKGPQNGVVATVSGRPIQAAEVDKLYAEQMASDAQQQAGSTDQADASRLQILHQLIDNQIFEQRAAKLNLTATDDEVDAKLTEMKAPYTEDEFKSKLKAGNRTVEDIRHDLRRSLTLDKLLNREINSKITVTDADVNSYFNAHKAEYNLIENGYHLAQIVVTPSPASAAGANLQNSKASSDQDARKKIQALKDRLEAGEDFGALAMNFSENPQTNSNGGDMGLVPESQLRSNAAVFAAIGKLKNGQNSEIVPFPDASDPKKVGGYAIFRLLEVAPAGQRDLNDPRVQQSVRQQLHDSRSQLLKAAYYEMLRDQAKVENYLAEQVFKNAAK